VLDCIVSGDTIAGMNVAPYKLKVSDYYGMSIAEMRDAAPFKAGDIVYVERFGKARLALIRRVQAMRNRDSTEWVPVYRVLMQRPDGTFNEKSTRTLKMYPGDVFRGYKLAGACPAEYL
jgi:hypothetical protein